MVVCKHKVLECLCSAKVGELLFKVADTLLYSEFLLTVAPSLLQLVAIVNVLGHLLVTCCRSNDLGRLE